MVLAGGAIDVDPSGRDSAVADFDFRVECLILTSAKAREVAAPSLDHRCLRYERRDTDEKKLGSLHFGRISEETERELVDDGARIVLRGGWIDGRDLLDFSSSFDRSIVLHDAFPQVQKVVPYILLQPRLEK